MNTEAALLFFPVVSGQKGAVPVQIVWKTSWDVACKVRWPATSCHSLNTVRQCALMCASSVCRVFLTYILLSTINSEEICVNQRPLQPASLLPLAQWQSRSADLIKTKETISLDFHFSEPPPPDLAHSWLHSGHLSEQNGAVRDNTLT